MLECCRRNKLVVPNQLLLVMYTALPCLKVGAKRYGVAPSSDSGLSTGLGLGSRSTEVSSHVLRFCEVSFCPKGCQPQTAIQGDLLSIRNARYRIVLKIYHLLGSSVFF